MPGCKRHAALHGVSTVSKPVTNIAASVRQRLLNLARQRREEFGLLLTRYALERLLYRISRSEYRQTFILKGALLFDLWVDEAHRPTRDADFLAHGESAPARFETIFSELCTQPVEDDGLLFDPSTVQAIRIKEDADYEGVRVTFVGTLANARIPVQIDIGFGDAITPAPKETAFPTLLDLPKPVLLTYPKETVIAEKFEAMVKLAIANSRMKDFYDLQVLAATFDFESDLLLNAIERTFERRQTPLPVEHSPLVFTPEFWQDEAKNRQWSAFITKNRLYVKPVSLEQVISEIRGFLDPLLRQEHDGNRQSSVWRAGGAWVPKD